MSRRGCSAEKAALGGVSPAMIADMATPSAIAACAGAVLSIDVNDAIMVESRWSSLMNPSAQLARERLFSSIGVVRQEPRSVGFDRLTKPRRKKSQMA